MRWIFVAAVLIITTFFTANAQTDKGTVFLSGTINFSTQKYNYITYHNTTSTLTLQPQIGVFAANRFAIGIAPLYSYDHEINNELATANYSTSTSVLGGGLLIRYYTMLTKQFGFYPQVAADYATGIKHNSSNYRDVIITPNLVFFPLPRMSINLGIANVGYLHQKDADGSTNDTFGFGINGSSLMLGVGYHFIK